MFAAIRPEEALGFLAPVSAVYLLLVFFIFRFAHLFERKLLALGLVTALFAAWYGQLAVQVGASVQVGPGASGGMFLGGDVAGTLGRIAVLLILGGVVAGLLKHWDNPLVPANREEAIRE